MNPRRFAHELSESVIAYGDAIDVPEFDEAAIVSSQRARVRLARSHTGPMAAASVVGVLALLVGLWTMPAVVAGVQRMFAAFTFGAGRRMPMTLRVVDLERARADMPFTVISPPSIAGVTQVAIDEMYTDASPPGASIIFDLHKVVPGPEVLIIESDAARNHTPTFFATGGAADVTALPRLHALDPQAPSAYRQRRIVLRTSVDGHTFAPASWVAHGTRVEVISPPGFLSRAQLRTIRRAMTR